MMSLNPAVILLALSSLTAAWIVPQPRQNIWVTLAQTLQQENICLFTAAAKNPMSTCLVGIPLQHDEFTHSFNTLTPEAGNKLHSIQIETELRNLVKEWLPHFPKATQEPQELELLGSSPASYCVHFRVSPPIHKETFHHIVQHREEFTAKRWCHVLSYIKVHSSAHTHPKSLPKGLFLICGDHAWAGIPSRLLGGPCTIGRLSLSAPSQTLIGEWTHKNNLTRKIQKRSVTKLDENCDSEIFHWSKSKRIAASIFLPWVAAAKALGELGHLECWVVRQENLTSNTISAHLEDEEVSRQATLQNGAAIDFLLLLHGHECQESEGLCCMNLTLKAPNIHATLREMKSMIGQVKQETDDWFNGLFKNWGLSGWWASVVKTILSLLVIVLLTVLVFGALSKILYRSIIKLISATSGVNQIELADRSNPHRPANGNWWATSGR
ncbi:uncharacterized protein LOC109022418 [Parus major]|uniref:uncharacterized protein LOC109022418 n=1 Tax=Parus major TaxID=9157 RepID=UPI0008F48E9B|nr:uncharacterized protein LOC109022418 [Parus major]